MALFGTDGAVMSGERIEIVRTQVLECAHERAQIICRERQRPLAEVFSIGFPLLCPTGDLGSDLGKCSDTINARAIDDEEPDRALCLPEILDQLGRHRGQLRVSFMDHRLTPFFPHPSTGGAP